MSKPAELLSILTQRASGSCELCGAQQAPRAHAVPPHADSDPAHNVWVCSACSPQLADGAELDSKHWFCLQEAIWSQVPAVQVLAWRLTHRLSGGEQWARDLLEQAYLEDEVLEWAKDGLVLEDDDAVSTVDSNGARLSDGDSVTLIRDLDVKGTTFVAKRGTLVKGIRLTGNPEHVEGKVNKVQIVLDLLSQARDLNR